MAGRRHAPARCRRRRHCRGRRARRGGAGTPAAGDAGDRRVRRPPVSRRVRRPRPVPRAPGGVQRGSRRVRDPATARGHAGDHRSDVARLRHRGAEAATPPGHGSRRRALGAVHVGTHGRLRPRRRDHPGRTRRRHVGAQRLQGLVDGRALLRLRDVPRPHRLGRPQAPRPHLLHRPDPQPWCHRPADQADQRERGVLPGVLRRRGARCRQCGGRGG